MQPAPQMAAIRRNLLKLIDELEIVPDAMSAEGTHFRKHVLRVWLTAKLRPRHRAIVATVAGTLLNGDWRSPKLQHICRGCCQGREETIQRLKAMLPKLLQALRPKALCRGNWCEWASPLSCIGILANMHHLLSHLFRMSFSKEEQDRRCQALSLKFSYRKVGCLFSFPNTSFRQGRKSDLSKHWKSPNPGKKKQRQQR